MGPTDLGLTLVLSGSRVPTVRRDVSSFSEKYRAQATDSILPDIRQNNRRQKMSGRAKIASRPTSQEISFIDLKGGTPASDLIRQVINSGNALTRHGVTPGKSLSGHVLMSPGSDIPTHQVVTPGNEVSSPPEATLKRSKTATSRPKSKGTGEDSPKQGFLRDVTNDVLGPPDDDVAAPQAGFAAARHQTMMARQAFVERLETGWTKSGTELSVVAKPVPTSTTPRRKRRKLRKRHRTPSRDDVNGSQTNRLVGIGTAQRLARPPHHKSPLATSVDKGSDVHSSLVAAFDVYGVRQPGQQHEAEKTVKVYMSQQQTASLREAGHEFPGAPPCTPREDQMKRVEYIPSMADIRAQRAVKTRLEAMEQKQAKKAERARVERDRQDRLSLVDAENALKRRQRSQIYALNKVMTAMERSNYEKFCRDNDLPIDPL